MVTSAGLLYTLIGHNKRDIKELILYRIHLHVGLVRSACYQPFRRLGKDRTAIFVRYNAVFVVSVACSIHTQK
jgi:hypothetical protein